MPAWTQASVESADERVYSGLNEAVGATNRDSVSAADRDPVSRR